MGSNKPQGAASQRRQLRSELEDVVCDTQLDQLRQQAQAQEIDLFALIEELRNHQEELRTQNQELRRAQWEAERAVARYARLFADLPDAALTLNRLGLILSVNDQALELFSCSAAYLQRHFLHRLIDARQSENLLERLHLVLKTGQRQVLKTRLSVASGADVRVELHLTRISTDKQDEEGSVVCIILDLTEHEADKAQLERLHQRAAAANQAKSEFLARMSHELRTPLNCIINLGQQALDLSNNSRQRDYLHKTQRAGRDLLVTVNDILAFSKLETQHLRIECAPFDLRDLIADSAALLSAAADGKSLTTRCVATPDLPRWLSGDRRRLQQVLNNLLDNAVKFTDSGEVALQIQCFPLEPEHKTTKLRFVLQEEKDHGEPCVDHAMETVRLRFSVKDSGIGLDTRQIAQLYQPFDQIDGGIARRYGGIGLGLVVCRQLLELMGSELDVHSQPGQGSCFSFELLLGQTRSGSLADFDMYQAGVNAILQKPLGLEQLQAAVRSWFKLSDSDAAFAASAELAVDGIDRAAALHRLNQNRVLYEPLSIDHESGASAPAMPSGSAPDATRLIPRLECWRKLLDEDISAARELGYQLSSTCSGTSLLAVIGKIRHAIDEFDIDRAQHLIDGVIETLVNEEPQRPTS